MRRLLSLIILFALALASLQLSIPTQVEQESEIAVKCTASEPIYLTLNIAGSDGKTISYMPGDQTNDSLTTSNSSEKIDRTTSDVTLARSEESDQRPIIDVWNVYLKTGSSLIDLRTTNIGWLREGDEDKEIQVFGEILGIQKKPELYIGTQYKTGKKCNITTSSRGTYYFGCIMKVEYLTPGENNITLSLFSSKGIEKTVISIKYDPIVPSILSIVADNLVLGKTATFKCIAADGISGINTIEIEVRKPDGKTIHHTCAGGGYVTVDCNVPVPVTLYGAYTVTCSVIDNALNGSSKTKYFTLTERINQPPSVAILLPQDRVEVNVEQKVTVKWAASDPDGDTISVTVSCGNGKIFSGSSEGNVECIYNAPGTYTIVVTASDGEATTSTHVTVIVRQLAEESPETKDTSSPTETTNQDIMNIKTEYNGGWSEEVRIIAELSFTPLNVSVVDENGTVVGYCNIYNKTITCIITKEGEYNAFLVIDGNIYSIGYVKIDRTPPEVKIISPTEDEVFYIGEPIYLDINWYDPGHDEVLSIKIYCDDEYYLSSTHLAHCAFEEEGEHTITVKVTDLAGHTTTKVVHVKVIKPEVYYSVSDMRAEESQMPPTIGATTSPIAARVGSTLTTEEEGTPIWIEEPVEVIEEAKEVTTTPVTGYVTAAISPLIFGVSFLAALAVFLAVLR